MVYCNHSSLVILVNDAKYIHFYPTFQLPPTLSHCKYKPFIKSIEFSLFLISLFIYSLFQILAKTFLTNLIIDLSYNFSKYMQFEVFENCLKWVVYIYTLFSPCIAWVGIESCLNFAYPSNSHVFKGLELHL